MPFVTESVWDALPASGLDDHSAEFLMVAAWPEPERFAEFVNERAEKDFELAKRVISCVRSTRARYRLSPRAELDVCVRCCCEDAAVLAGQEPLNRQLGRLRHKPPGRAGGDQVVVGQNAAVSRTELYHQFFFCIVCNQCDRHTEPRFLRV